MTQAARAVVETRYGRVEGMRAGPVWVWRNIPYAAAPTETCRFLPPEPPAPWPGVRDATTFGPIVPQVSNPLNPTEGLVQDEDALALNVWSPGADGARRPVMVWIHGGAFVFGSGRSPWYDGTAFAAGHDVVVVTINYRLGPLGFLYLRELGGERYRESGNAALLDQVAALRWVRENIAAFGGDPDRVTVFGESAGAMSVALLLTMPAARGLFARAVIQSGLPHTLLAPEQAAAAARAIMAELGLGPDQVDRLHAVPAAHLVEAAQRVGQPPGLAFRPVLDGVTVPAPFWDAVEDGAAAGIPVLVGSNRDELRLWTARDPAWRTEDPAALRRLFETRWGPVDERAARYYFGDGSAAAVREGLARLGTYRRFRYPVIQFARRQRVHAPVWVYRFDWASPAAGGILGACHALEIPFVFNTVDHPSTRVLTGEGADRRELAARMQRDWAAFARAGDPAAGTEGGLGRSTIPSGIRPGFSTARSGWWRIPTERNAACGRTSWVRDPAGVGWLRRRRRRSRRLPARVGGGRSGRASRVPRRPPPHAPAPGIPSTDSVHPFQPRIRVRSWKGLSRAGATVRRSKG